MTLATGLHLGPYEILSPLGVGGMGEVYRARDTKLQRDVALKVLPESFANDPDRLARFQREAQVLASLNHPNIAHIHGLEESGGVRALVMELVEGEDLAQRLTRGAIPIDEALPITKQIAEALEAAYEHGIIHRDLKPANIKVRDDGTVKVLDFGLAKAMEPLAGGALGLDATHSPTLSLQATRAGMILGTAAYMAPEQAKGRGADRRSDIWAFGCVLYEMLTGERRFGGDTVAETLASVMKDELTFGKLPSETPSTIRALVARCLDRDIRRRVQSIGEARIIIEDVIAGVAPEVGGLQSPQASKFVSRAPWGIVVALLLALAALAWAWYPRPSALAGSVVHFTIPPPENATLIITGPNATNQAVSPDGRYIAFVADEAGGSSLWVRPLGSPAAQKLDRTVGAAFPFWSPDSQFIAFFQDGKLRRIPVSGGSALTICDAPAGEGGTWNRDGIIVFAPAVTGPLHRVLATGGVSAPVTELQEGETSHSWPWFLPDGQRFLYLIETGVPDKQGLYVQSLGSTERTFLMPAQGRGAIVEGRAGAASMLVFMQENTVLAQPLDLAGLRLGGKPVPVAENVRTGGFNGRNSFSVSETGVMVYRPAASGTDQLTWYMRDGKPTGTALKPPKTGVYAAIELSPDDAKVVVIVANTTGNGGLDLWLLDLPSGVFSPLTGRAGNEQDPLWSPDSRRIAFASQDSVSNGLEIHETAIGSGMETTILADGKRNFLHDWSRDGKTLLFQAGNDVSVLSMDGDRKTQVVFRAPYDKDQFRISPDGRWVAYRSSESGQPQVWVASFPTFTDRRQISTGGAMMPLWRHDGRELFYVTQDRTFAATDIKAGATLVTGPPKVLFQTSMPLSLGNYNYAVTGNGQKFLVREPASGAAEPLHVILNWPSVLGQ